MPDTDPDSDPGLPLPVLLARVLLGFAIRFEESIAMAMGVLGEEQLALTTPGRGQQAFLTAEGQEAQWRYADLVAAIERGAGERFGKAVIARLREDLEALAGDPAHPEASPLMRGLEPYPDNWRAEARPPQTLPHYPMVLHRGGYPDGS